MVSTSAARASHGARARDRRAHRRRGDGTGLRVSPESRDRPCDVRLGERPSVQGPRERVQLGSRGGIGGVPGLRDAVRPEDPFAGASDPNDDEATASVAAECVRHVGDRIGLRLAVGDEDAGAALRRPVEEIVACEAP